MPVENPGSCPGWYCIFKGWFTHSWEGGRTVPAVPPLHGWLTAWWCFHKEASCLQVKPAITEQTKEKWNGEMNHWETKQKENWKGDAKASITKQKQNHHLSKPKMSREDSAFLFRVNQQCTLPSAREDLGGTSSAFRAFSPHSCERLVKPTTSTPQLTPNKTQLKSS